MWATLQSTGTQLHDAWAKKEQLAARIQEVQAMLAMDTGRWGPLPTLTLTLTARPRAEQPPTLRRHRCGQCCPAGL